MNKAEEVKAGIKEMLEQAQEQRNCSTCIKVDVCTIFRANCGLLGESNFPKGAPIKPEDVGSNCKSWVSAKLIAHLNGGEEK